MITLAPDDEQLAIATSVSDYLEKQIPLLTVRAMAAHPEGVTPEAWAAFAELGWFALGVPEGAGGLGGGAAEETMLLIEAGRRLLPGPLRTTLLAARIAAAAGEDDLTEALISGERRAGIECGELAIDARPGDLLIRLTPGGASLVEVTALAPAPTVDPNTRVGRATTGATVARADGDFLTLARLHASAELLGVLEAVRDMSAAYAQTRTQFGVPIGTFQAVKHRCADMAVAAYAARGQIAFAAVRLDAGEADAPFQVAAAYQLAMAGAQKSAKDNIQNHGGIGFTWEQDCHLYLKRAMLLSRLYGIPRDTYDTILAPSRCEFT